ncbi:MAG: C39 family peptidase [Clostridiales bacterium]|nr:C39 family peptidase [Clostridiales bacterium]
MTKKLFFTLSFITIALIFAAVIIIYILLSGLATVEAGDFYHAAKADGVGAKGKGDFSVYCEDELIDHFTTFDEALACAQNLQNASIKQKGVTNLIWNNCPPYIVYTDADESRDFETYEEAAAFADGQETAYIYYRANHALVYEKNKPLPASAFINGVPQITQLPELPRGCEVTSLAMLINYMGVAADKMTLAEQLEKNPEPHTYIGDEVHCGDPNDGFVGSMTSFHEFGLGVYHKPIFRLLAGYFPDAAVDLTGADFEDLYYMLAEGAPVWVIINSQYTALPESEFEQWHTPNGVINITYREHSVLVTGYDAENIYFNDPLGCAGSAPKADFISAWEQMGKQAVAVSR